MIKWGYKRLINTGQCIWDPLVVFVDDSESEKEYKSQIHTGNVFQRICSRLYPMGFLPEFKHLLWLAIPISITSVLSYLIGPVSMAFCGHLGKIELATIGLATSVFNVAGLFVAMGLLTACDTLFSQIYGSHMKSKMGVQMYRTVILLSICCIPCWAMYLCVEPLLLLLHQNPLIAKNTASFLRYLIPALFFASIGILFSKYVQTQDRVYPPLIIISLVNCVNALLHYVFLYHLQTGVMGSAIAQTIAYASQVVFYLCYFKYSGMSKEIIWTSTREMLEEWGAWFRLALPGLIMVSLEWTIFEVGGFIAGSLGAKELAVQTVLISIDTVSYTLIPYGFGSAASIRVGQYLGSQSALGPRSVFAVAISMVAICALPYIALVIGLRHYIPRIFSSDMGVNQMVADLMPIVVIFQMLDGANGVCGGVLRGSGLQWLGAVINFFSLYIIGGPLGLCFVYWAKMSLKGIWLGLIIGAAVQVVLSALTCCKLNWTKQVEKTIERINLENESKRKFKPVRVHISEAGETITASESSPKSLDSGYPSTDLVTQFDLTAESIDQIGSEIKPNQKRPDSFGKLVLKRSLLVLVLVSLFTISLTCSLVLKWSDYFGIYCIYPNDTFISVTNKDLVENCTLVIP